MRIARFGACAIGDPACDALLDAVRAPNAALRLLGLERNPRISAPKHDTRRPPNSQFLFNVLFIMN